MPEHTKNKISMKHKKKDNSIPQPRLILYNKFIYCMYNALNTVQYNFLLILVVNLCRSAEVFMLLVWLEIKVLLKIFGNINSNQIRTVLCNNFYSKQMRN